MKKIIITLIILLIVVISAILYFYYQYQNNVQIMGSINKEYESFYQNQTYGTNVMSLMNKAIDNNNKNGISKNDKGYYIENDTNSIKITIKFKGEKEDEFFEYSMEQIAKQGSEAFIKNFGAIEFKCTNIEYHEKTHIVKYMYFEQI